MKKTKASIFVLVLAFAMALTPLTIAASAAHEPFLRVVEENIYVPLRPATYALGGEVEWDRENRAALITFADETHVIMVAEIGGFIEGGMSWVPFNFAFNELILLSGLDFEEASDILSALVGMVIVTEEIWEALFPAPDGRVERVDLTLWDAENFEDIRDASFSTDLPHGEIAVNYVEFISDNIGGRSAFTYRELEAAVWIVEELLAMGHDWDNIDVQEFTYWCAQEKELGLSPLRWSQVTSRHILGVGREYLLRPDRVSQNVVLTIPGQSEQTIIVGAHYDSPPYASASDNASGIALLLESAQRMMELDHYYTIVYVFFGAEEVGLVGAFYYYESLTQAERDNIVVMVNADVLIEGPYVIYGVGAAPSLDDVDMDELIEAILEFFMYSEEEFYEMLAEMVAELEALGVENASALLPFDSYEQYFELIMINLATVSPYELLLEAAMYGLIPPVTSPVSEQISALAAELTSQHDFELIAIPEMVGMPSDQLVFLHTGHLVVNLAGLERRGVLPEDFVAQLTRYGEGMGEFTATILHTPLDEFHFIEYTWPGMMNANMKAFSLFLEAILTSIFG